MADDWRVTITFRHPADVREAVQAIRAHQIQDDAQSWFGDEVVVSADGPRLLLYAADQDAARAADRMVREVLAPDQSAAARFTLDRWHPDEQDWEDASVPMPGSDQERAAEHERLMDYQTQQSATAGQPGWQVRVELPSHRQAVELAGQLRAQGRPVIRRWKYLILGAANQDEASALAGAIAQQSPADASVRLRVNPSGPFRIGQPGTGGAEYLVVFLAG